MVYWLLTTEYPPFFGGGISTYCLQTSRMLLQEGHSVTVFLNDDSVKGFTTEYKDEVRIIRFSTSRTGAKAFLGHTANLSYEFAHIIKEFIEKEGKPSVIEAQDYLGIAYYLLQFKYLQYQWCSDLKIFLTLHSPAFLYLEYNQVPLFKTPNYWIGEMERFCIKAADFCLSPSLYLIDEIEKRVNINRSKIAHIPNPYKSDVEVTVDVDPCDIVFFGKLSAQKGIFKLLNYFSEIWNDGLHHPLHLIGGQDIVYHPENRTMGDVVKEKYAQYIDSGLLQLEDKLPPSEIAARLRRAKVVIIPSTVDNLPYVAIEMMSLGLIVLVSKQGGQAEIIEHGVNGFVFDHTKQDSFKEQLERILNLSKSERHLISEQARQRIKVEYDPSIVYQRKMKVILETKESDCSLYPYIRSKSMVTDNISDDSDMLSVIVPYYNMGKYIGETIDSILASHHSNLEIIIINDGSNDDFSIKKLKDFEAYDKIRIIHQTNCGLASTRNKGAELAKGNYIAFLDADDKVSPSYYSQSIKVLKNCRNIHFVGAWTQYFDGTNKVWPTFTPEPPLILFHNLINSSSLVYRRMSYLEAGKNDRYMPFQGLEDYDSVISLVAKKYCGVVLPELHFKYRVRNDSMIRGITDAKKQILYNYISDKHDVFFKEYSIDLINLYTQNGSGTKLDNPTLENTFRYKIIHDSRFSRRLISIAKRNKNLRSIAYKLYHLFQ